jgi:CheY-like chemotaxis protein
MVTKHTLKEGAEQGHSVLIVEDNITNQKVLAGFLSRLGLNADIATSGQEALESIKKRAYELVIMDTQMPEMDGLETTQKVREYEHSLAMGDDKSVERAMRTPIIALGTSFMDDEKEECLRVGMDGFLKKPVNMKSMEDLLVQWGLVESNFAQVS